MFPIFLGQSLLLILFCKCPQLFTCTVKLLLTTPPRSDRPPWRDQTMRPPHCKYNKYSAFRTSEKQPPLISDQRPISQSHLAQNKCICSSMSDQRPYPLKIWEIVVSRKLIKNSILHYFYSIQFCLGQKVFAKCSQKVWCFYFNLHLDKKCRK